MRLGTRRLLSPKKSEKNKLLKFFTAVTIIIVAMFSVSYLLNVIRPAFAALAENQAKQIAVFTINKTISQKLAEENTDYHDIVEFERDNENNINAVKSNLAGISKLKSDLNLEITEKIAEIDQSSLKVPLGSLLGSDIFAGFGPDISFRIKPYGVAVCDVHTDFIESGINQTKLDVTVNVKANVSVLMPTMRKVCTVSTSMPIISTVIVGEIPQSFTHVDRDGNDYENDVMDLAK